MLTKLEKGLERVGTGKNLVWMEGFWLPQARITTSTTHPENTSEVTVWKPKTMSNPSSSGWIIVPFHDFTNLKLLRAFTIYVTTARYLARVLTQPRSKLHSKREKLGSKYTERVNKKELSRHYCICSYPLLCLLDNGQQAETLWLIWLTNNRVHIRFISLQVCRGAFSIF